MDVVCLGETMALIAPDPPRPLAVAERLVLSHGGAESNVAVSLARLGSRAQWCSRLGDDAFGRRIAAEITAAGVDTSAVRFTPERTGVFFKDPGPDGTRVRYYRDRSAASSMDESDADRALAGRPRIVHLTGITPALSASCARAVDRIVGRAHDCGALISFDVNYRAALWTSAGVAGRELRRLAQRCDIVFVGRDEAAALWNTTTEDSVRRLLDAPGVLVVKDGASPASSFTLGARTQVSALAVDVLEPVGAGDAFAAGWLHGYLIGMTPGEALRLGHLVAAGSLTSSTDHSTAAPPTGVLVALARDDSAWPTHPWPPARSSA